MEEKLKDERISKLKETAETLLRQTNEILSEKDERLDNMTNSEWGGVVGQKLAGQANRLTYAAMFLEDALRYLTAAEEFDDS